MEKKRVIIIGAAGRDFHIFNVLFRESQEFEVVAFTAAQIPFISDRLYPPVLSGRLYPKGIKIYDEGELQGLIKQKKADVCVLAYSDLQYETVMHKASLVNSCGADFWLIAPEKAMVKSTKPLVGICGVRTGVGKSQTARYVSKFLRGRGLRVVIIRHPMPYGILKDEVVERFARLQDLDKYKATIEEREDYEPHIRNRFVVYAGVDYGAILRAAEKEADVIIWDGGNNDAPFYSTDLLIGIADPLRAGSELTYYPGETVARMSDILIINKVNSASPGELERVRSDLRSINPKARIALADSVVSVGNKNLIKGKKALLIEDGPTITHGGMAFGAATVAAKEFGVAQIVNAKPYARGTIKDTYARYPRLGSELPAMGYSPKQVKDLEDTINLAEADVVLSATPTDLKRLVNINKPLVQVSYELRPRDEILDNALKALVAKIKK
jgi:predicted GTPase